MLDYGSYLYRVDEVGTELLKKYPETKEIEVVPRDIYIMEERMIKVTAYFSASIRGRKGSKATKREISRNIEAGKKVAAQIRDFFGSMLDIYCPHDQDELVQILWNSKKITVWDILDGDCQIVSKKQILLVWAPKGFISSGMAKEVKTAKEKGIPIIQFERFDDETASDILNIIFQILKKEKEA